MTPSMDETPTTRIALGPIELTVHRRRGDEPRRIGFVGSLAVHATVVVALIVLGPYWPSQRDAVLPEPQLAITFASLEREDDAMREARLAMLLRPNEPTVLYNAACTFCMLQRKPEALDAIRKAWDAGFKDAVWARRDPDLTILHDDPEFQRLYPAST